MQSKTHEFNLPTSSSSTVARKEILPKGEKTPFIDKGKAIPQTYGETKVVIMPRDPAWAYTYWDIADNTAKNLEKKYGKNIFKTSRVVIRIYEVTGVKEFTGKNAKSFFDVDVNLESRNWYLKLENADRKQYCVDLGLITKDGKFIRIARSNIISMPSGRISDVTDEEWMVIQEDFEKLMKLSGDGMIGKSSAEAVQMLLKRMEKMMSLQQMGGSGSVSSFGLGKMEQKAQRSFWLLADAELIVYGATEKNAKLRIKGEPMKLKADGSFHLRFALPDGTNDIPIEASSHDDIDNRKITITVSRSTK